MTDRLNTHNMDNDRDNLWSSVVRIKEILQQIKNKGIRNSQLAKIVTFLPDWWR